MQGHIRKRSKDSWTVVVDLGRDPLTGKRRRLWRSVKGTKKEAEALLVQLLHQRDQGIDQPSGKVTVGEFLRKWLDDYARPNTAPRTFPRYEQLVRIHLVPPLGQTPLTKLRPLHIQDAYRQIREKGLAERTVLHCHRVLREALAHAVKWQMLSRNVADAVEAPRPQRFEIAALTPEQVERLLSAAESTPYGALVHAAVMTGLRLGELMGLRWQDVNLEGGALQVRQSCQWLPRQGFIFRQPKTRGSIRSVALSPETVHRLRQHRRQQLEHRLALGPAYHDDDLVFASPLGTPVPLTNLRRAWQAIVRETDLGHMRFHDLRHAHASLLLQQGVHPKIVSERLGHSTVNITLDIYSHLTPNLQAEAAVQLDRLMARARKQNGLQTGSKS